MLVVGIACSSFTNCGKTLLSRAVPTICLVSGAKQKLQSSLHAHQTRPGTAEATLVVAFVQSLIY